MTWVVGATTPFGYGVVASDICVTLRTAQGTTTQHDILRKTYPVGRFIVAGFAGSVRIGFQLLDDLRAFLQLTEDEVKDKNCWQPAYVAENWAPNARAIFARQSEADKKGGAEILMVGIDPHDNGLGRGVPVVSVLRTADDFQPSTEEGWGKVMGIGIGTIMPQAMDRLQRTVQDVNLMQAEVNNPGGFGRTIAFDMTRGLFFNAPPGVSRHLHVTIIGLDRFALVNNDTTHYPREGEPEELRMPKVAESDAEMRRILGIAQGSAVSITALGQ
jgi:hypothetical protein